jgi:hypothetical protein
MMRVMVDFPVRTVSIKRRLRGDHSSMPTYRIGSVQGRPVDGRTPCALVCEACNDELEGVVLVERGQERFAAMTPAGVTHIWPNMAAAVQKHEGRCWGAKR